MALQEASQPAFVWHLHFLRCLEDEASKTFGSNLVNLASPLFSVHSVLAVQAAVAE